MAVNCYISYRFYDAIAYVAFLFSAFIIFLYISKKQDAFKRDIILVIFFICLFNLAFCLVEIFCKLLDYSDVYVGPFFHCINIIKEIGGINYQTEFNALLLNTTALISIYYFFSVKKKKIKILLIIIYLLSIYISVLVGCRAAFLSMFVAIIIYYTIATFKKFDNTFRKKLLCFFLIYFLFIAFDAIFQMFGPITKFYSQLSDNYSIYSRLNIWFAQVLMFLKKPFFGWGLDCFKYINAPYQVESLELLKIPYNNIGNFVWGHNEFLQLLCEGGIFFIIFLFYLFYRYFIHIIKYMDEKKTILLMVLLIFIVQSMFSWPLRNPSLVFMFVSIMGVLFYENNIERNKGIYKKMPVCIIVLFLLFFMCSFSRSIASELIYIPKIELALRSKNYVDILIYTNKLAKDKYLIFEANDKFVYVGLEYILLDIFKSEEIPISKEDYEKIDEKKLFYYDKLSFVDVLYKRAENLNKLRPFTLYRYAMSIACLIKGDYDKAYTLAQEAEALQPADSAIFNLMHFINVLRAAKTTHKDVITFLPSKREVDLLNKSIKKYLNEDIFDKK